MDFETQQATTFLLIHPWSKSDFRHNEPPDNKAPDTPLHPWRDLEEAVED